MKTTFTTTYKFYSYDEANYFHYKRRFMRTFRHVLEERMPQDLEVSIANLEFTVEDRPIVTLEGPNEDDLIFTKNALKELVGEMTPAQGVNVGDIMFGQLKEVGNVGFG